MVLHVHDEMQFVVHKDKVEEFKTIAKRPKYSLLNISKIKKTFNLEIPNYKQSLEDCIKVIKNEA